MYPKIVNALIEISETHSKILIASFQVILSQSDFLSFDHAPEADPESPGDYWAIRFIDPLRVFSYLPEHRCCNLVPDEFTFGKMPFAPYGCIDDSNCLESKHPENVTGANLSRNDVLYTGLYKYSPPLIFFFYRQAISPSLKFAQTRLYFCIEEITRKSRPVLISSRLASKGGENKTQANILLFTVMLHFKLFVF